MVLEEPFLHPEDCGKVLGFLGGWAWNLQGLELLTPGAARKWGVAGEGGRAGWTQFVWPPPTSCIPGAAGAARGSGARSCPLGLGLGCRGQGLFLSVCLLPRPEECSFLSQPDPEDPTGRKSPGLARVGQSGFRPWGCRSLAVWPRASDFASLSPFPHRGEWG